MNKDNAMRKLREQFGPAFPYVSDAVKRAMIDAVIMDLIQAQDGEHMERYSAAWLQERAVLLRCAMFAELCPHALSATH